MGNTRLNPTDTEVNILYVPRASPPAGSHISANNRCVMTYVVTTCPFGSATKRAGTPALRIARVSANNRCVITYVVATCPFGSATKRAGTPALRIARISANNRCVITYVVTTCPFGSATKRAGTPALRIARISANNRCVITHVVGTYPFGRATTRARTPALRCGERRCKGAEYVTPIARSQQVFAGAFGMRHQSQNIPFTITNARYVVTRSIGICRFTCLAAFI